MGFQYVEFLVFAFRHRAGNNQGGTGIVDQYTIHLIHHREMQFALHHFGGGMHHIIAEIIETKFVVGTVSNIGQIGLATGFGIRLVFIDTIYR